jgi:hypothetical protein
MERIDSEKKYHLNKGYFRWLINQRCEMFGLGLQGDEEIDKAIEKTQGLVKKVLEASFEMRDFKSVALACDLTRERVQQLYAQALDIVFNLIKRDLMLRKANIDENN